ncbi:uncharacterized protein LOC126968842 [Leptidea sinapis]|uniref:uncharacterized protein LOC126968842 n=1 Tax=Leptidea sinapis TaxID=189913 RepID=UPI0021386FF9|nr:uncharacterized protein LOC126968842 [Leptidea sinapis]
MSEIFIFGNKLFAQRKFDPILLLPLEMAWKIFSYLDEPSLRKASKVSRLWKGVILSKKSLRSRLNMFEVSIVYGSKRIARYYKKQRRIFNKMQNYMPANECLEKSQERTDTRRKRGGDAITVYTKRFKLF